MRWHMIRSKCATITMIIVHNMCLHPELRFILLELRVEGCRFGSGKRARLLQRSSKGVRDATKAVQGTTGVEWVI